MEKEIEDRLTGLESIIYGLHHNLELLEYISYGLHREPFNLSNNFGLVWIWRSIMANQIVDFYKVITKDEKFSFTKIINISRDLKCEIDYKLVENGTKKLMEEYDKTDFETVRSKYIAHQDLNSTAIKTDLPTIGSFTKNIIEFSYVFFKEFKKEKIELSSDTMDSFKKIFETIDEYEKAKAFLVGSQIKGHDKIEISKLIEFINDK